MLRRASQRAGDCARAHCRGAASAPPPPRPGLLGRLLPADPPELAAYKKREARLVKAQLGRSKLAEARAAGTEKLFLAPPDIVAALADNAFPPLQLHPVSAGGVTPTSALFPLAPATLVTLAFQGHGQAQLTPWLEAVAALRPRPAFGSTGGGAPGASLQHLNVLYLQGWFFQAFSSIMLGATVRAVAGDAALAAATGTAFQPSARETDHWADKLRIANRMQAHVFLVDAGGLVRWQASGPPGPGELDNLAFASRTLEKWGRGPAGRPPGMSAGA